MHRPLNLRADGFSERLDPMTPRTPRLREPDSVTVLQPGPANRLHGLAPDRCFVRVLRPEMHLYRSDPPAKARALVYAGGGYLQLVHDKEGIDIALWLNSLGIDAWVLVHRLPGQARRHSDLQDLGPGEGPLDDSAGVWPFDIALRDALCALDHLAALAPLPLLHVGLSSGGHLAGVMACQTHALQACGAVIAYAPLNANHRHHKAPAGKPDYPPPEKQAFYDAWPVGIADEPHGLPRVPVFLAYALHDAVVPVDHALNLLKAAQVAGLDVEAHVFPQAPHGFALRSLDGSHAQWPALAAHWLARRIAAAGTTQEAA